MTAEFKSYSRVVFLVWGLFIIACLTYTFAEKEPITDQPQVSREECLRNFNIDYVDFTDFKVISNIPLLTEYFQCRAAVRDDVNECNNLHPFPDHIATCRKYFNSYQGYYGNLLTENTVTDTILTICKGNFEASLKKEWRKKEKVTSN